MALAGLSGRLWMGGGPLFCWEVCQDRRTGPGDAEVVDDVGARANVFRFDVVVFGCRSAPLESRVRHRVQLSKKIRLR